MRFTNTNRVTWCHHGCNGIVIHQRHRSAAVLLFMAALVTVTILTVTLMRWHSTKWMNVPVDGNNIHGNGHSYGAVCTTVTDCHLVIDELHGKITELTNEIWSLKSKSISALTGATVGAAVTAPTRTRTRPRDPPKSDPQLQQDHPIAATGASTASKTNSKSGPLRTAVLLFTFNRERELRLTLESLLSIKPSSIPLFVSQDENHAGVTNVINEYRSSLTHLNGFRWQGLPPNALHGMNVYYKIARHFHYALTEVFNHHQQFDNVILIEDDMNFAVDFFDYFASMAPILHNDDSLYCVSSWNDNGQGERSMASGDTQLSHVNNPQQLYRSEVFPGLGWMMTRALWNELGGDRWALGFWDDWLREPQQRKGRSCIYPEVNRVASFGKQGSSGGQMYDRYIAPIKLNDVAVPFNDIDITYITTKPLYDSYLRELVATAEGISSMNHLTSISSTLCASDGRSDVKNIRIIWHRLEDLTPMLDARGLITDHKAGIPRASYQGVIPFRENNCRVLLVAQRYLDQHQLSL